MLTAGVTSERSDPALEGVHEAEPLWNPAFADCITKLDISVG